MNHHLFTHVLVYNLCFQLGLQEISPIYIFVLVIKKVYHNFKINIQLILVCVQLYEFFF